MTKLITVSPLCGYVLHSLIVEDKSSFTATTSTDPVELLHSVCTMASPVEGVALAITNDIILSALPVVNSTVLVGGDMFDGHWERSRLIHSDTTGPLVQRIIKL